MGKKRTLTSDENIHESESHYQMLVELAMSIVLQWDTDGKITFINEYGAKLFGYKKEELIGKNVMGTIVGETDTTGKDLRKMIEEIETDPEKYLNNENENTTKDGRRLWIHWRNAGVHDSNKKLTGILSIGNNITDRKLAEEEIRVLASLVDIAPASITVHDTGGVFLYTNQTTLDLHGYSKEEYLALNLHELDTPESADMIATRMQQLEERGHASFEVTHYRKDGSIFPLHVIAKKMRWGGKNVVLSVATDITEHKQSEKAIKQLNDTLEKRVTERTTELNTAVEKLKKEISTRKKTEKSLKESEARYRRITESVTDYIYTVRVENGKAIETRHGNGCLAVTGYTEDEFAADPYLWINMVFDEDRALVLNRTNKILAGAAVPVIEHRIVRKDSSQRWVRSTCVPKHNDKGMLQSYDGLLQDITERKRAETELLNDRDYLENVVTERTKELIRAKEAAETSARAKSEFLANMSHEIRTPMSAIMGMTHLALDTKLTFEQKEYLEVINQASKSLLTLLNDILNLSKIEAGKFELENVVFDLKSIIKDSFSIVSLQASEKGLTMGHSIAPGIPMALKGDAARLKQILINLLGNSVKFTDKGSISLEVKDTTSSEKSKKMGRTTLLFSVHDTGIGIPYERQQDIFDAFSQVDGSITRKYGGTGLGLAICKKLVELMNGTIWIESEPHKGTTFHFISEFEIAAASDISNQSSVKTGPMPELKRNSPLKILLAEDNDFNQMLAVRLLEKYGNVVTVAGNGLQAIEHLEKERFDLVLMDVQMPEMDGLTATGIIRNSASKVLDHDVPVIAMTANALSEDREKCLTAGMSDYISKPIDPKELLTMLLKIPGTQQAQTSGHLSANDTAAKSAEKHEIIIDMELFNRYIGRLDDLVIASLLENFRKNASHRISNIMNDLKTGDTASLKIDAHSLKSMAASIGAEKLRGIAFEIERAATGSNIELVHNLIDSLKSESERVLNVLSQIS